MPEPEYDSGLAVRGVCEGGKFRWKGRFVFLTKALAGERIGLEAIDEHRWRIYFAAFPIACFDSHDFTIGPHRSTSDEAEEQG